MSSNGNRHFGLDSGFKEEKQSFWQRSFEPISYLYKLRGETRRYRWRLISLGFFGVLLAVHPLLSPLITREIIDAAYLGKESLPRLCFFIFATSLGFDPLTVAKGITYFFFLSALLVGLNFVSAAMRSVSGYVSTYVGNLIAFRVRMRVFNSLHRVPVSYVEGHHSGMFLERIASDADKTAGMLSTFVPQVMSLVLTGILTIVVMANISFIVTVLVLGIVPLYYLVNTVLASKLRVWQKKVRRKDEELTTRAVEAIQGVPTARLFGVGKWLKSVYVKLLRDKIKMAFGMFKAKVIWGQMSWAVSYGWGVVLTVGGWYLVFQGRLSLGDAVALGMYIPQLLKPAEELLNLYKSLMSSSVPAQRVLEVIDEGKNGLARIASNGFVISRGVTLKEINFSYPGSSWHLDQVSLDMECGDAAVIIGPTGSGKTTLLRLLAGMYDKYDGIIAADGSSIKEMRLSDYQKNVSMVMADNFFFTGSIMENMRIAAPSVSEEDVRRVANALGIDDWLMSLKDGYDTTLGVGGMRLSSGQTQKIAILRAVLKNPRLMLLDEITSAMDVESERRILDGLYELRSGDSMTIMTTHRLTLTMEPWINRIIVLDDGAIKEQGEPGELYKNGGEYRRLMTLAGLGNLVWRDR